jgi:MoaA/NifB/PqqE/SkfB family radical SAM enzyme
MTGEFPKHICIDPSNTCNGNCVFCEYPRIKQKRPVMDFKLFERIIGECTEHDGEVESIGMPGFSELFILKGIERYLSLIRECIPGVFLSLTSNGSMAPEQAEFVVKNNLADLVSFSIDGGNADAAKTTVGWKNLTFQEAVRNVETFIEIRNRHKSSIGVVVNMTLSPYNIDSVGEFVEQWDGRADAIQIGGVHNGGGNVFPLREEDKPEEGKPSYCSWPFEKMWIQSDGVVALCCHDAFTTHSLGDLKEETIRETWNGEKLRVIREHFENGKWSKLPLCGNCCALSPGYDAFRQIHMISERYHDIAEKNAGGRVQAKKITEDQLNDLRAMEAVTSAEYYVFRHHRRLSPVLKLVQLPYGDRVRFGKSKMFRLLKSMKRYM